MANWVLGKEEEAFVEKYFDVADMDKAWEFVCSWGLGLIPKPEEKAFIPLFVFENNLMFRELCYPSRHVAPRLPEIAKIHNLQMENLAADPPGSADGSGMSPVRLAEDGSPPFCPGEKAVVGLEGYALS